MTIPPDVNNLIGLLLPLVLISLRLRQILQQPDEYYSEGYIVLYTSHCNTHLYSSSSCAVDLDCEAAGPDWVLGNVKYTLLIRC